VDDAAVVGGGESGAEFAGGFEGLVGGEAADAGEEAGEVLAVHVLHGDKGRAFDFADVVDAADVGVGDEAGDADFAVEAFEEALVAAGFLGEEFEGDGLAEGEVGSAVDFAHAAAAEEGDDAVASAEEGAGDEAAFVPGGGGGGCDARDIGFRDGLRHGGRHLGIHSFRF
jgi:hypothetical protein